MTPDRCGLCQELINSVEESIECIGPCEKLYHLKCANIDVSEREFFVIDGISRYKCHTCTRRDNDEVCVTPIPKRRTIKLEKTILPSTQLESLPLGLEQLVEMFGTVKNTSDCTMVLLKEFITELSHLSKEIKLLRKEHAELKHLIEQSQGHFPMMSNQELVETNSLQSSAENGIDKGAGEPSVCSQSDVSGEDLIFKVVHKSINRRPEIQSTESDLNGDLSSQKIFKFEARINSKFPSIKSRNEMNSLSMNNFPPNSDKELLKKMAVSRSFPWKFGSYLLILAIFALLSYDIQKHGSFRSSSTGIFLNDIGALQYGEHAWARTKFYSEKSYRWAEANVPQYYKSASDYAKPYLELAWDVCLMLGHQMHYMYENGRAYVEEKTPLVIEWVNHYAPGLLDKVKLHSIEIWEIVKKNALLLWQYFLHYSFLAVEWVQTNVFVGNLSPENLQKYSMEALNTTQVYAVWTYDWVCRKVQTLSKIQ